MLRLHTAKDRIGMHLKARIVSGRLPINIIVGWLVIGLLAAAGTVGGHHQQQSIAEKRAEVQQALNKVATEGWLGKGQIQLTHDSDNLLYACSGYQYGNSHTYGVTYASKHNVCVGVYSISPDGSLTVEGVDRALCYRNGVQWGDGVGGCRWTGTIDLWVKDTSISSSYFKQSDVSWCYTCGGAFVSDSGRQWGAHFSGITPEWDVVAKGNSRQVRYHHADGTEALYNELENASGVYSPS